MCARVGAHKITRLRNWDVHALSSSVHNEAYMRSLGFSAPVVESTAVVEFGLGEVRKQIGENAAVTYLAGDFRAPIFDGEPVDVRSSVNETPFGWTFGVDFSDGTTLCSAMSGAAFREDAIDERFLIDGRNPAGVTATGAPPDASLRE